MNLQRAVLFLAAAAFATFATSAARAQAAVYGTFTVNQLSGIKNSPAIKASCPGFSAFLCPSSNYNDSVNLLGGTFGGYYDFFNLGPVKLGVDARGILSSAKRGAQKRSNGTGARLYSGLGGVRAVFHTRWVPIRPYIQGSAGFARTDYGLPNTTNGRVNLTNNFQYMGYAGVDITLLPVMDFRMVEFGYGGINPFGNNSHNYPVKTVSSGIVFHLPF